MLRSRGYGREVDLSPAESEGIFLEGTGVLVHPGTSDVVDILVTVARQVTGDLLRGCRRAGESQHLLLSD